MIAKIEYRGGYWYGTVEDEDEVLYISTRQENRPGCALRTLLNGWQAHHGKPGTLKFELDLDEW